MKLTHYTVPAHVTRTIAVLADFHSADKKQQNDPSHISRILNLLREAKPDLILSPGDIFNSTNEYPLDCPVNRNGLRLLTEAVSIAPVYYSIGNHEQGMKISGQQMLEDAGVTVLDNETATVGGIVIGGMTSGYRHDKSYYRKPPSPDTSFPKQLSERKGYKILLCHHPEYWKKYILGYGIDLTISGHAHGGQWGFFGQRGVYAPGQGLFPKYVRGMYEHEQRGNVEYLAVSRGMTNTVCVPRFFNPCEIVVLHLGSGVSQL
ncbi:MAG: metallophosphoesterase [Clostridia bacterium]|nr:metallophosphoesterase [Clostridia bacterium]